MSEFASDLDALDSLQPAWQVYRDEGDFSAELVDRSVPDGGSSAIRIRETTGGGTAGTIGLGADRAFGGWDGAWTLTGLYFSGAAPLNVPFQKSAVYAAYDPETRAKPVSVGLGFTTGSGAIIPFRIRGSVVDTVELATDPGWQSDTWYRYEVSHDGDGEFVGRLWPAGESRPSEPTARSTGSPPPSGPRIFAASVNGARAAPLAVDHAAITWDGTDSLDATATVLSYVPGLDENDAAPGADADQDFYSAFPNRGGGLFPRRFPIDGGFVGDQQQGPPGTVGAAIDGKTVQGLDEPHDAFRVKNSLAIEFETEPEGRRLDSDVAGSVRVNTQFSERNVVFRGGFDLEFDVQLFDPEDPEEPSKTIVEEGRLDDVEGFLKNFDRRVRPARTNTRYVGVDRVELEKDGEPIEGVRAATVWGGSNPYSHDLQSGIVEAGADFVLPLQNNPVIYSWVELTVLADGTKLVRVPDATPFPKHAGYLAAGVDRTAGTLRADSKLEVEFDPAVTDSDDGYDVAINEEDNNVWNTFVDTYGESFLPEDRPVSPYSVPAVFYLDSYREEYDSIRGAGQNGFVERPIMAFGRAPDGSELDRGEALALLDTAEGDWFPLSPFDVPSAAVMDPPETSPVPGFGAAAAIASVGLGGALWRQLSEDAGPTAD